MPNPYLNNPMPTMGGGYGAQVMPQAGGGGIGLPPNASQNYLSYLQAKTAGQPTTQWDGQQVGQAWSNQAQKGKDPLYGQIRAAQDAMHQTTMDNHAAKLAAGTTNYQQAQAGHNGGGQGGQMMTTQAGAQGTPGAGGSAYLGGPSPTQVNPYLDTMAGNITGQVNTNLGKALNGIDSQSVVSGGVGGARQGLAQGQAIGDANAGLSSALGSLYGGAFENQAGRDLAQWQTGQQVGLGYAQNQTNRDLGFGGLDQAKYATDANSSIAQGQLGLGYQNSNNAYALGNQANATNMYGLQNQFTLGQGANTNQANQIANNYTLGQGNLSLGNKTADNAYDLGNKGVNNQWAQMVSNAQLQNQGQQLDFYTSQRGQDLAQTQLGANMYLQGVNGQYTGLNNAANNLGQFTGFGNTNTSTGGTGGGLQGLIGGAGAGFQWFNGLQQGWD